MATTLPIVRDFDVTWVSAEMAAESNNSTSYGSVGISLVVQGPENPNFVNAPSVTYWLPEDTPNYLVAYQQAYEYLKKSTNFTPDQLDQLEYWNQKIVEEVNTVWTQAGLPAPDLTQNDWSMSAPFFTTYQNKQGVMTGQFDLMMNGTSVEQEEPPTGGSGF